MGFDWETVIIQVVVLLLALSFHEMAHAWAAFKLGDSTARDQGRLTMNPISHIDPFMTVIFPAVLIWIGSPVIFGAARPVPVNTANLASPKRDHMWIAAAGPISNIMLAAGAIVVLNLVWQPLQVAMFSGSQWAQPLRTLLSMSVYINLVLAAFNMIPLYPLDGSWVLSRFLSGPAERAYAALRPYGFFILVLLMLSGRLGTLINPVMGIAGRFMPWP